MDKRIATSALEKKKKKSELQLLRVANLFNVFNLQHPHAPLVQWWTASNPSGSDHILYGYMVSNDRNPAQ
jgi:hypothetical protein